MDDLELVARLAAAALVGLLLRSKEGGYDEVADRALAIARRLAKRIRDEGPLPP